MKVLIVGAGATGCYLYSILAYQNIDVSFLVRSKRKVALESIGQLTFTDYEEQKLSMPVPRLITDVDGESFDLIFVMVKCHQVKDILEQLSKAAGSNTVIVLMQNGLGSEQPVLDTISHAKVIKGITQFNVLSLGHGVFHKGTEGDFIIQHHPIIETLSQSIKENNTKLLISNDIRALQHGKLLLNLNNALNAILDLPIKQELENSKMRKLLAAAMEEWLAINNKLGQPLAQLTSVKMHWVPKILRLPNWLFNLVAQKMLAIDPKARSSMWEDIQAGRKTEIEFLNEAVVRMGKQVEVSTPVNQAVVELIKRLEQKEELSQEDIKQSMLTLV